MAAEELERRELMAERERGEREGEDGAPVEARTQPSDEGPLAALLELVCCPVSGAPLQLLEGDREEGLLGSEGGYQYPIIGAVPRLLPPALLTPLLQKSFPTYLSRWPALAAQGEGAPAPSEALLETMTAYSYQHVSMADEELLWDEWRQSWDRFQPGLAPEQLAGKRVLEVGCGEGRHARLVSRGGAEILVGLDLSRGVERARALELDQNHHFVQGDLRHPPFRPGVFDALSSNGVLHHTPEPAASFAAVAPLLRPNGLASVWVYGLDEMRWTYRASHLTWLRPLTNRIPRPAQLAVAAGLTVGLEAGLWTPTRLLRRVGAEGVAARIPYQDAADRDWRYKLRRVFDRLNPPITHYISREALREWFAHFEEVEVINADGQGWTGRGRAPA